MMRTQDICLLVILLLSALVVHIDYVVVIGVITLVSAIMSFRYRAFFEKAKIKDVVSIKVQGQEDYMVFVDDIKSITVKSYSDKEELIVISKKWHKESTLRFSGTFEAVATNFYRLSCAFYKHQAFERANAYEITSFNCSPKKWG